MCSSTKAWGLSAPGLVGAEIADAAQLIAHRAAVLVGGGIGLVQPQPAGIDQAAQHVGLEARALLVGEERHGDRPARRDLGFVQRPHDLEAGQHAVIAIVTAAGAHRVDVAAGHDRRQVLRSGAQADHVADGVDADVEPERLHPAHDQIAADPVFVGERQPGAATTLDGTDPSQFIQRAQQAPFVEPQHDFPNGAKTLDRRLRQGKISRRVDLDCLARA